MPPKPLKQCSYPGCRELSREARCEKHRAVPKESLRALRSENADFYHTNKWKTVSKAFRDVHLLCAYCLKSGIRTRATITHHNPELSVLLAEGKGPYDWDYLDGVCFNCHQKELRRKR